MDAPVGAIAGAAAAHSAFLFRLRRLKQIRAAPVAGAFVVTALGLGSTYFFKSGFEAQARGTAQQAIMLRCSGSDVAPQEEMREREKNVFGKNTLPKSKPPPKRR